MPKTPRPSWYHVIVAALLAGGLIAGADILYRLKFDVNALLTFLGAVIGVAGVVLISTNQRDREVRRNREDEASSIDEQLASSSNRISEYTTPLLADPIDDGAAYATCDAIMTDIKILAAFVAQVMDHAKYLSFAERMHVANLAHNCASASAKIKRAFDDADRHDGKPHWDNAHGAVITLQNAISIVSSSRSLRSRRTP